jgi:hypothetical protein
MKNEIIYVLMSGQKDWNNIVALMVDGPVLAYPTQKRAEKMAEKLKADRPEVHYWVERVELIT